MEAQMAELNIEELARKYQGILQDEGYGCKDPQKNEDNNTLALIVKYERMTLLIIFDYDDPAFVRILLPTFYSIDQEAVPNALAATNAVAAKCKCAKAFLTADASDTTAAIEYLETGESVNNEILLRYLSMAVSSGKTFAQEMADE